MKFDEQSPKAADMSGSRTKKGITQKHNTLLVQPHYHGDWNRAFLHCSSDRISLDKLESKSLFYAYLLSMN